MFIYGELQVPRVTEISTRVIKYNQLIVYILIFDNAVKEYSSFWQN